VLIATVSVQIPLLTGNLTGKFAILGSEACALSPEPPRSSHFCEDSLVRITRKHFVATGNSQEGTRS
jgi:hypothetical protein